ncbi:hypothetical protein AVEN_150864-1 [Araneus ventricosus]|uniref:Uncharacterized protein n=1 Tax=Araneus ventricosus TaxID=182803 RepID=A0A4Y2KH56_ARAVE|nr:hypothetical protein AVEN_150864-1 [Araneus ventricosus]
MPRKRYLTLEKAVQRHFGDDEQSDIHIVVVPPETAEASYDKKEVISYHIHEIYLAILQVKLKCAQKRSLSPLKVIVVVRKNLKSRKLNTSNG